MLFIFLVGSLLIAKMYILALYVGVVYVCIHVHLCVHVSVEISIRIIDDYNCKL